MSQKNKYILSIIFVFILVGASIYGLMAKGLGLGLDLKGGLSVVLTAKETSKTRVNERTMKQALFIMRNRVDKLGVSEPSIERHGKKNIIVQLPGIKDPKKALDIIGQTALLEFAIVKDEHNSKSVAELNKMLEKGEKPLGKALMRGDAISNASGGFAQSQQNSIGNKYEVTMKFTSKGAQAFGDITSKNVNKSLAIILDNKIMTAPNIQTAITDGNAVIEGMESLDEAKRVALVLQTGQLPFELEVSQQQQVGPTLGQDSLNAALMAAIIGFALVALYMIAYYRVLGLIAWLSLGAFASLLFGTMVLLDILLGAAGVAGISLSLPSIAGVILLIGIAADSSIIIFERIK
ncbi:MAG TPA: protein translocase subunit SecD, partial [Actinobacteria bacterium]|nr:protein translocase subunit SecD [Actinomycetota bacterium]